MTCARIVQPGLVAALLFTGALFITDSSSHAGETVINMPPPPKAAVTEPRPVSADEGDDVDADQRITWRDQVERNDIASDQRSSLGVVALTRFARTRAGTYDNYYVAPRSRFGWDYHNDAWRWHFGFLHHGLHFPGIDVSFLHGVPIGHGFQFGIRFPHHRLHW